MRSKPVATLLAAACACLVFAGCSGDRDTTEGRKIEALVKRFALSHGPDACAMLTPKAVATVYGHTTASARVGRANCVSHSKRFKGQPVDVTFVTIASSTGARATARTLDGTRYWTLTFAKVRGRWLIDSITRAQRPS